MVARQEVVCGELHYAHVKLEQLVLLLHFPEETAMSKMGLFQHLSVWWYIKSIQICRRTETPAARARGEDKYRQLCHAIRHGHAYQLSL